MQTITQQGVVDGSYNDVLNANFQELLGGTAANPGGTIWVRPQAGVGNADGSYDRPYGSFALAVGNMTSGCTVGFEGVAKEQWITPLGLNNVTVIGSSVIPRQATTSGVPNGAGATWLAPASPTTSQALVKVQGQGWTFANILFNSTGITSNGCIEPYTVGDPPLEADGAKLMIYNCILTGAKYGIRCPTGTNYVQMVGGEIFGFSDSGDVAISATGSIGTLLDWKLIGVKFFNNANNIIAAASHWTVTGCNFEAGTVTIDFTNGTAPNFVVGNYFNIAGDDFDPAGGVTGVTGDVWSNTLTNAIETGLPAN